MTGVLRREEAGFDESWWVQHVEECRSLNWSAEMRWWSCRAEKMQSVLLFGTRITFSNSWFQSKKTSLKYAGYSDRPAKWSAATLGVHPMKLIQTRDEKSQSLWGPQDVIPPKFSFEFQNQKQAASIIRICCGYGVAWGSGSFLSQDSSSFWEAGCGFVWDCMT
jgi:hypothetical protein